MGEIVGFGSAPVVAAWALSFILIVGWLIAELLKRRLITVPNFVLLWVFFLPIILQYPFTFSPVNILSVGIGSYQSYRNFIDPALLISLLGMAAFLVGLALPVRRTSFSPASAIATGLERLCQPAWLVAFSCFILLLYLVLLVGGLFGAGGVRGAAQMSPLLRPLYNVAHTILPLTTALTLLLGLQGRRIGILLLSVTNLALGLLTGARSVVIGGILFYGLAVLGYESMRRTLSVASVLKLVPLAGLLLILALYIGDVREGQYNILLTVATTGAKLFYGNNFSDLRDFAWVRSYWNGELYGGKTEIAGLLAFVPTALLPFRGEWNWGVITTTLVGLNPEVTPGLRAGIFGEPYFNFGLAGVVVAGLFYGYMAARVHRWALHAVHSLPPQPARLKVLAAFVTLSLAAFVTLAFAWATIRPYPGAFTRYFAYYWVWGLCAVALLLGMAEYKTSPLRKGGERGHLFILLYVGALLIITRALNMFLYGG